MTQYGWSISCPSSLVITHTTLSSVKLYVLLSEANYFHALWKETLNNVMYCMLPKVPTLCSIKLWHFLMFWGLFYNFTTGTSQAHRTKQTSDIEMDSDNCCYDVLMVLPLPINPKYWNHRILQNYYLLTPKTNSMGKSPSWEAKSSSASQEITTPYGTHKFITTFTTAHNLSHFWATEI